MKVGQGIIVKVGNAARKVFIFSLICLALSSSSCKVDNLTVASVSQLIKALDYAAPGNTIFLEDGTYYLHNNWAFQVKTADLTIRSKSGNRGKVVIEGRGMHASGHHGFFIQGDGVTLADLTIRNVRNHCIQTAPGTNRLHIKNCILQNAGEQILKVPTGPGQLPSENGLVEGCLFEYSAVMGPRYYIGGIDVHNGKNWIVRDNVFKFIRSPEHRIAEHAIHFWSDSADTLVERNLIINCDRGIGFGMGNRGHKGGIIRNNMIFHDGAPGQNDVGIGLESAWDPQVYNNTIFLEHDYPNAIEARFPAAKNILIANNLTNKTILMRDGATATMKNNYVTANSEIFVDPANGNLHIDGAVQGVFDAGIAIEGLTDDFDKQPRPQGKDVDIGADEYEEDWHQPNQPNNSTNPINPITQ